MKKQLLAAVAIFATLFLTGCAPVEDSKEGLQITNGWVRSSEYSDHVGGMTGAFAEFTNKTDRVITILGGSSDVAAMVEAHEVVMLDGEMTMQAKEGGIAIQPGETITLEPGGLHIMLMGLNKAILEGEEVSLTIDLDGADDVTVTWPVKPSIAGHETYAPKN